MVECFCPGDARVGVLLGRQKPPESGKRIRRSCFVFCMESEGETLVFHTLTRMLLSVPEEAMAFLAEGEVFPASVLEDGLAAKLYEHHFLVPEDTPESEIYLETKDILVLKEELPRGITHYVILPTSTCNARCFYCFEQGMRYQKMAPETVEDTLRFIMSHRPKDRKDIHIHWFGGEPMCAEENIDRICDGLKEAGIEYTAEMTSNGSLFTEASAKKAAEVWKVGEIQITLDGMADEYAKRKRYSAGLTDPFGTVIRNMHLLLAAGIKVTVRLNADEENLQDIYRVIDFLRDTFTEDEKKKMRVYAHSLFGQQGESLDGCPMGAASDELEAKVLEVNEYIIRQGMMQHDLGQLFSLKSHFCMVTAPECNVLIDAAGQLFACDGMPENMRYGDVKKGIDPDAWNRVSSPCAVRSECSECVFLPQCTEFDRCPSRVPYDDCFRQERQKLERDLRYAHEIYREQKKKSGEEKAAGAAGEDGGTGTVPEGTVE